MHNKIVPTVLQRQEPNPWLDVEKESTGVLVQA
ncbi:hypothetical protein RSal33209_2761 [Renibacterium salmoninarum ATCC 33209]|uniref:Uncharacterized protein n=1 Tax=Renibacterium salmoninarum (strain ATCC 33209 / DSM 20767 / JCM 11484 / NBRC 15589 / NCIMB 2235) TaxID=288705 RepID=A9WTG5_RENSM|nr:hypothetical protein RSal33209_2761 [Renibacterium salmoninarum ATCC 33209]